MTSRRRRATRRRVRRRTARRRLVVLAVLALGALALGAQTAARSGEQDPPAATVLALRFAERTLARVPLQPGGQPLSPTQVARRVSEALPATITLRRGRAQIRYRLDRELAARRAQRRERTVARIAVPGVAIAASIAAPVVQQKLRNDCEAAALEVLLATVGVRVDQLTLLGQLARSAPLDPQQVGAERVWGDPDQGFVGRPDGGGPAGGFGVYQRPLAAVARRQGVAVRDLSGRAPGAVYARLRAGHAVLVWVGLSDGPYGTWRTPAGKEIRANFNEHTVVLNGIDEQGTLDVVDPLTGTRIRWSASTFETMWARLEHRALST